MTAATKTVVWLPTGTTDLTPLTSWLATAGGRVALDTETTGLDPRASEFACKQLAFGAPDGTGVVVDGTDRHLVRQALVAVFQATERVYAHNAAYDAAVVYHCYGVRLASLRDTLTAARCAWPGKVAYGLKVLRPATADSLADLRAHWEEVSGKHLGRLADKTWLPDAIDSLPPDDPWVLAYVASDAVETARLAVEIAALPPEAQNPVAISREVKQDQLWRHVSLDGIKVDRDLLASGAAKAKAVVDELSARHGVDFSSRTNALASWVQGLGIVIHDAAGKPTLSHRHWADAQVPEAASEAWADFCTARAAVSNSNKIKELLRMSAKDGRIYPTIGANAADQTGRMAVSCPALQNLAEHLRPALVVDDGKVLVGLDLDQVEPRVVAALSGDEAMRAAVQGDPYLAAAAVIWTDPADADETARRRKVAKTVLLAQFYGQGTASLARRLGIPQAEAGRIRQKLLAGWPKLRRWLEATRRAAEKGQPLETAFRRRLPSCQDAPYKAVNWVVQGTAADAFKAMVSQVADQLQGFSGARLWLPVHDELVVECLARDAEAVASMMGGAMRLDLDGVVLSGQPAVLGRRWAHA